MAKVKLSKVEKKFLLGVLKGKRADLRARLDHILDDYDELNVQNPITEGLKEQIQVIEGIIPKLEQHFIEIIQEQENE